LMLLLNSFVYYGIGYGLLSGHETGEQLLGLFTLGNALIHFLVSTYVYRKKLADKNLFYLVSGMVLIFITIAIPVQLNGHWVTLLWVLEATLLFWIGRSKKISIYEKLSYPLMLLATLSLLQDWNLAYDSFAKDNLPQPWFNATFLSSLLVVAAFGGIHWISQKYPVAQTSRSQSVPERFMIFAVPGMLLGALYFTFYLELDNYWQQLYLDSKVAGTSLNGDYSPGTYNTYLLDFGRIWALNYSLLFLAVLALVNIRFLKNKVLGVVTLSLGILAAFLFLTGGLYLFSELREGYLDRELSEYYEIGFFHVGIRYIALAFFALLLFALKKLGDATFMKINFTIPFELFLHLGILWILSSEWLNWMDILGSGQSYKLGLSILWGTYALLLVVLGIWKNKRYLRLGAMVLFGFTLIKLFFYDIASLDTIPKTVVFVSLGVLLLIVSFLYNKYKDRIPDDEDV
ncbi:MAG: DUF2339 domain-containing protein, partial [Bacteroidota bacterium]